MMGKSLKVWIIILGLFLGAMAVGIYAKTSLPKIPQNVLKWDPYKPYKVALAEKKQLVIIDFYADWCVTCHELEKYVFSRPDVQAALSNFVRLRVDATNPDSIEAQEASLRYRVLGLPTLVFLDVSGKEIEEARVIGYVPPAKFLKSIRFVVERSPLHGSER